MGTTLPIFLHSNANFRLPEDTSAPVIMIGPGTGIAPFRAFLERTAGVGADGKELAVLWGAAGEAGLSVQGAAAGDASGWSVDSAGYGFFAGTRAKKIYVQDRMQEHAGELFEWLERGAYFYVCGDATRMAKDVETALLDAIAKGSNGTLEHAAEYLAAMKKQKRYQRDVY